MMWNFFATGHRKGQVDGARTLFKWEVHKEQIKPHDLKLQNIGEVVAFLKAKTNKFHDAFSSAWQHIQKHYWKIEVGAIDQSMLFN